MKRISTGVTAALACTLFIAVSLAPAEAREYRVPRHLGMDVDHCLDENDDASCGQPAADRYCKMMGYEKAASYTTRTRGYETIKLGTDHVCRSKSCVSLYKVDCSGKAAG